jgi:hypothetical protein
MRSKLLTVAIAAGLGVTSFSALAATKHQQSQPARVTVDAATLQQLQAQLAALQAQVADLQAKQEAQADAQVETAKAVNDVQVAATKPTEDLSKKVDKLSKFVNDTKIGGTMFFDLTDMNHKERVGAAGREHVVDGHGAVNGTGFDVKRFYLVVDHTFDDIWSANLTTDFSYQSSLSSTSLFVKKAYVQGKFDPLFTVRFGATDMPWIPFVEKWYGYRYVENTITDRSFEGGRGTPTVTAGVGAFGNSSDWGIHALGETKGDNSINYQLSVVNGRGYRNLTRSKGVDAEGRIGYSPIEQMVIAIGGYSGKRGLDSDVATFVPTRTASRGDAMIAWRDKTWGVGAEYFHASNWDDILRNGTGTGAPTGALSVKDKTDGYSAWADWKFYEQFAVFARYDHLNYKYTTPTNLEREIKDKYYNAGVSYDVLKNLKLALVYKHNEMNGPVATPYHYKTNEVGFWGMLSF